MLMLGLASTVLWTPDKLAEELKARWAPAPSTFIETGGLRVHVRDEGPRTDAHPLVMLHGSGSSLHTWSGWAEVLRTRRRVVTLDLPGFGLTGPSPDDDYSIESYLRFMTTLLDRLGIRRPVLVGRGIGGEIGWQLALKNPSSVDSLVLVSSAKRP
jgi:pimeloyl-ACP methyl ester carboxylesterase